MTGRDVVGLDDGVCGAVLCALSAADALFLVDNERKEMLTYAGRTLLVLNVCDIFVAEISEGRKHRVGRGLTESAERRALDECRQLLETIDVLHLAFTVGDLVENFEKSSRADTAGSALSAGFIDREFEEELRDIDHAGVLVHYDESARAHHRADGNEVVVVDGGVDERCRDAATRRTSGLSCLEFFAVRNAAADLLDNLAKGSTHRDLNESGVSDLSAEREDLSSLGLFGTHR